MIKAQNEKYSKFAVKIMETLEKSIPVKFTKSALEELHNIQSNLKPEDGKYLRIGVKGGGCSGMSYLLAFDNAEQNDNEYNVGGVKVVMNKAHLMYVVGMDIDYENGLNNRGFTFKNPNAKETCGCGTSFSA